MSFVDSNIISNIVSQWLINIGVSSVALSPIFILYWGIKYGIGLIKSLSS